MAGAQTPEKLVLRGSQGFLSEADARRGDEQQHLDSFASASAGLMQLSSVAAAAANPGQSSVSSSVDLDSPLPPGWNRVTHASGLPCFANFRLGLVSWSKPYTLGPEAAMLAEPDFTRLVKRHVPPLSIFVPPERIATAGGKSAAAGDSATVMLASPSALGGEQSVKATTRADGSGASTASAAQPTRPTQPKIDEPSNAKKRKVEAAERAVQQAQSRSADRPSSMTMEEFKTLPINDPRVLQACMELSIKTPAQVLQEYQNRNRGVSINYNTVPYDKDGVKLFKTIVTAGSTVAEGIASTKKIAKQLGAQQLLALLHERTARLYIQVADLYSVSSKGQQAASELKASAATSSPATPSMTGQAVSNSLRSIGTLGRTTESRSAQPLEPSTADIREAVDAKLRKYRRPSPTREYPQYGSSYSGGYDGPSHWGGYGQNGGSSWVNDEAHVDSPGAERIVVYSSPSSTPSTSYTSQYYSGGPTPWTHPPPGGGLPAPPPASSQVVPTSHGNGSYSLQHSEDMSRGDTGTSRQHGYSTTSYHSRSSDRLRSKTA